MTTTNGNTSPLSQSEQHTGPQLPTDSNVFTYAYEDHASNSPPLGTPLGTAPSRGHPCYWPGCTRSFTRKNDAFRHFNSVHAQAADYWCTVPGCPRSEDCNGSLGRPFGRKDHRDAHVAKTNPKVHQAGNAARPATIRPSFDLPDLNGVIVSGPESNLYSISGPGCSSADFNVAHVDYFGMNGHGSSSYNLTDPGCSSLDFNASGFDGADVTSPGLNYLGFGESSCSSAGFNVAGVIGDGFSGPVSNFHDFGGSSCFDSNIDSGTVNGTHAVDSTGLNTHDFGETECPSSYLSMGLNNPGLSNTVFSSNNNYGNLGCNDPGTDYIDDELALGFSFY